MGSVLPVWTGRSSVSDAFPLMRARTIGRLGASTPMVVPSFSSRGFPAVADIVEAVKGHLFGTCLVSAFDMQSGLLSADLCALGDVVIVDSGGYETSSYQPGVSDHYTPPSGDGWTRTALRAFLRTIPDAAPVIVVAFDYHGEIERQFDLAAEDFACAPQAARCLLLKPLEAGGLLSMEDRLPAGLRKLEVIGVTENELGQSMADRCRALVRLRRALGPEVPIHVFGTIGPRSMLTYTLCGADVFDGLNWLRYGFEGGELRALIDRSGLDESDMRDDLLRLEAWRKNLRWLSRFQNWLRGVAAGGLGLESLMPLAIAEVESCQAVARACGAQRGGGEP